LLARLIDVDDSKSKQALADQLGRWLSWTDAISLSAALNGHPGAARSGSPSPASDEVGECMSARSALANSIAEDSLFADAPRRMNGHAAEKADPMESTADFSPYRRRYVAKQQAMQASIGALRDRLRGSLSAGSPQMARLAAVDAVMEQVLGERERSLLSIVPVLLERHFEHLRRADEAAQAGNTQPWDPDAQVRPGAWLGAFRARMQGVLLAELDFRMQPVEGLLEALRMRQPGHHE
jgi:hypothetical protein